MNIHLFGLDCSKIRNLSNPWAYVNTKETDGNVDSVTKKVIKPIKQGEELFGTYNLENTILK